MDSDVAGWVLEFILRQVSVGDRTLNSLIASLPLPPNNFHLNKSILLHMIETEAAKGSASEKILDLIEHLDVLDHVAGDNVSPATEAMKRAYCYVAVECTVRAVGDAAEYFEVVRRVWRRRVGKMGECECGLVSDELVAWRDEVEAAVCNTGVRESLKGRWREKDALGAVRVYLAEAWEGLGPSFLEVAARMVAIDSGARGVLGLKEEGVDSRDPEIRREEIVGNADETTLTNDTMEVLPSRDCQVSQKGTLLPRRKHVAKKRCRGSVGGTSRGAKITDIEQVDHHDLSSRYGCLTSPEISKVQEALRTSSSELQAVVNDPLPEALQLAENVETRRNTENMNPEVQESNADPKRPATSHQHNAPKPSLMTRNSSARTYEWNDSIDNLHDGDVDSTSKIKLPSPKNRLVSPLKKHETKNVKGRRRKFWSALEEETLRAGVKEYGKGSWKAILNANREIFEDRTDVDLKDKWRNMTR